MFQSSIGNIDVKLINLSDARPESNACHSNLQHRFFLCSVILCWGHKPVIDDVIKVGLVIPGGLSLSRRMGNCSSYHCSYLLSMKCLFISLLIE